jgi:phage/plasmid-like protein (TIGR03299 family)
MPANVETMYSVREVPWHGEGVILKKHPRTISQALVAAGLDWDVKQVPVQVRVGGKLHKAPGVMANVREHKDGEVKLLGVVTKKYKPVQNREAFEFLANLYGTEMLFETAGALAGGRRVWVLMKLPEYVEVAGDSYMQYAFVSNSHDGKSSVLSACTPIRIVCENTERAAIRSAQRTYMIRHMGDMSTKIAEARNVLGVTINYYEQFKALGDRLGRVKFSDKRAKSTIETILPHNEEKGDRAAENVEEARRAVMSVFKDGFLPGADYDIDSPDTRGNAAGSAWSLYNAATEYADWGRDVRVSRWKRAVDDPDGLKTRAFAVVLERAGVTL